MATIPSSMVTETKCKPSINGDGKPSLSTVVWPCHGRYFEYPEITTHPQQDKRKDGLGVTIHPATDNRLQPWNKLVRANMHSTGVNALPPKGAEEKDVQEFLYLVLTYNRHSQVADQKPWLVSTTLSRWHGDSQKLRTMTKKDWEMLCPARWWDVYLGMHTVSKADRKAVGKHIMDILEPLIRAECAAEKYNVLKQEKMIRKKKTWARRFAQFLCFKGKARNNGSDDESLPLYKEKE